MSDKTTPSIKKPKIVFVSKTISIISFVFLAFLFLVLFINRSNFNFIVIDYRIFISIILILPVIIFLILSRSGKKYTGRIISRKANTYYLIFFALCLLSVLGFFSFEANINSLSFSPSLLDYLTAFSLQVILVIFSWFVFYSKVFQITPTKQIVIDQLAKRGYGYSSKLSIFSFNDECYDCIANNDMPGLFQRLKMHYKEKSKEKLKYSVLFERQYNETMTRLNSALLDFQDAQIIINRISLGIIEMIDES